MSDTNHQYKY